MDWLSSMHCMDRRIAPGKQLGERRPPMVTRRCYWRT
jgi:hypothetical protein